MAISSLHGVGRPYYGGSEGAQPKRQRENSVSDEFWAMESAALRPALLRLPLWGEGVPSTAYCPPVW